jgi:hypothetical protein
LPLVVVPVVFSGLLLALTNGGDAVVGVDEICNDGDVASAWDVDVTVVVAANFTEDVVDDDDVISSVPPGTVT